MTDQELVAELDRERLLGLAEREDKAAFSAWSKANGAVPVGTDGTMWKLYVDAARGHEQLAALCRVVAEYSRERVAKVLCDHWPDVVCHHETKTDTAFCSCGLHHATEQPTVGKAVEEWAHHVASALGAVADHA